MDKYRQGRRDFLRGVFRTSILAGLAALGGFLFSRKRIVLRADENCVNGWICSGCSAYSRCGLPPALSRREALGREALGREVNSK
jgi:hypothetical protein